MEYPLIDTFYFFELMPFPNVAFLYSNDAVTYSTWISSTYYYIIWMRDIGYLSMLFLSSNRLCYPMELRIDLCVIE